MVITLEQEQYEALVALARKGASDDNSLRNLDAFLKDIEGANGVTRYALWIQWQEAGQQLPLTTNFPKVWPPELRFYMELISRPIAKVDVDAALAKKAIKPMNVLVTRDPAATTGWTDVTTFFAT